MDMVCLSLRKSRYISHFVLGITHKDSSIRKLRFLHMSMDGHFCAELHNSKACSNLLETIIQCKITLLRVILRQSLMLPFSRVSTWNSNDGRPCLSPVYINTRLHQADLPLLTRLIQSSRNMKRKQQQDELTERSERSTINATWKMSRSVRSVQGETSEILEFVPWSIEIWSAPWP